MIAMGLAVVGVGSSCDGSAARDAAAPPSTTSITSSSEPATTGLSTDFSGGVDGPVMFAPGPPLDGGDDAAIEGVLVLEGECLFVGDGGPESRFAVIWPFGTTWDAEEQEIVLTNGGRIAVGATLSAGGGYGSAERATQRLDTDALTRRAFMCTHGRSRELAYVQHSISVRAAGPFSMVLDGEHLASNAVEP